MFKRFGLTCMVVSTVCFLGSLGCAALKKEAAAPPKQAESAKSAPTPLGEADEMGPSGGSSASESASSADASMDKDLKIPGQEFGVSKPEKGKKATCPKGKKGKQCREDLANAKVIPVSDAINDQMKGIPWGLTVKAVVAKYERAIRDSYKDQFKNAAGAIEEDRLQVKMQKEISDLKKSYVTFDGKRTGYEGVMIEPEFTHNNGESMLMWDAGKFVEYLFFIDGRFWKRLRAFRKDSLGEDITFEAYAAKLTDMYGKGAETLGKNSALSEIKWQSSDTYLSAVDRSSFYGVYCMTLAAKVTEDNLAKLRTNAVVPDQSAHATISSEVEAVTAGDFSDNESSVIDSYTGVPSEAPVSNTTSKPSSGGSKKDKGAEASKPSEEAAPPSNIDDIF